MLFRSGRYHRPAGQRHDQQQCVDNPAYPSGDGAFPARKLAGQRRRSVPQPPRDPPEREREHGDPHRLVRTHQGSQRRHPFMEDADDEVEQHEQRSEENTSELQSLMRISYAVCCLTKKKDKDIAKYKSTITTTNTII